jgi:hypothetical protein
MMPSKRRWKLALFAALPTLAVLAVAVPVAMWLMGDPIQRGQDLNRAAWELSYTERGLGVPPQGPREGYWGSRLKGKTPDPQLAWREAAIQVPDLLDIDADGLQHYRGGKADAPRVLVLGGSVAFGAYASEISKTYFHVLGEQLARSGTPADITVMASGAWKSIQDLTALERHGPRLKPDVVVFLNGLNDLSNGATWEALYGQPTETHDGSEWTVLYHAGDYELRAADYLRNMRDAADLCSQWQAELLIVLQPSLAERGSLTRIEEQLLAGSLRSADAAQAYRTSYQSIRLGLRDLGRRPRCHVLDASRLFDAEPATTFTDLWHFADPGHEILGRAMARQIGAILRSRLEPVSRSAAHADSK